MPIAETAFDTVNFALTSASTNAIGTGVSIPGVTTDYNGATRTIPTTIGALVYTGSMPPPISPNPAKPPKPTATAVFTVAPGSATTGQDVTASINIAGNASTTPVGTVTFYLPNGPVQLSLSSGKASSTFAFPGPGIYSLTASYSGDGTYPAAYSNTATVNVTGGSSNMAAASATTAVRALSLTSSAAIATTATATAAATAAVRGGATSGSGATQVSIVPAYRTLYANQPAELQSFVLGGTKQDVAWSVLSQPSGGDGQLLDNTRRDTVFSATVAGRYTLLATSLADPSQTAIATLYVTGHVLPYRTTALGTEPVDCSVDPALSGKTYDVGPSQAYQHLRDLPMASIGAGSTIRIHNEDASGLNPTTFHEFLRLSEHATADQPLRLCGVPDGTGHLPVLDASNATAAGTFNDAPAALLTIGSAAEAPAHIHIEGVELRNANGSATYQTADGRVAHWPSNSGCLRVTAGQNIAVIGNDLGHCSTGGQSAPVAGAVAQLYTLWEGNHLHDNGVVGSSAGNQLSLGASGDIVQFNQLDSYPAGALGSNIRSRSLGDIIRYNYLGGSPVQQINLTDAPGTGASRSLSPSPSGIGTSTEKATGLENTTHLVYSNYYQGSRPGSLSSSASVVSSR